MPDRVLDPSVWAALDVASAGVVALAARKTGRRLDPKDVPLMGVMTAAIFAGQMVNFPVGFGVSGHLVGAALAAILMGVGPAMLMMTTVLILQCLLFGDGGLLALGTNVMNMGIIAPGVAALMYRALRGTRVGSAVSSFVAGWISVVVASASAAAELCFSGFPVEGVVWPILGWHALIGVGEGLVTVAALQLVWRTRPDLAPARVRATEPADAAEAMIA